MYVPFTGQLLLYNFAGDGSAATSAALASPKDLALDTLGNIYIADGGNQVIRKVTAAGIISTIAGTTQSEWTHSVINECLSLWLVHTCASLQYRTTVSCHAISYCVMPYDVRSVYIYTGTLHDRCSLTHDVFCMHRYRWESRLFRGWWCSDGCKDVSSLWGRCRYLGKCLRL